MRRAAWFTLAQVVLGVLGLAALLRLDHAGVDYYSAAYFFLALAVFGLFDVWLPRGDSAEIGGAIAFGAGLILHPGLAVGIIVGARLLVWTLRRSRERWCRVADDIARRSMVVTWSAALSTFLLERYGAPSYQVWLLTATLCIAADLVASQIGSSLRLSSPLIPLVVGNLRLQGWMSAAQVSAGVLVVMTHESMGALGLGIVVGLLLVVRQSFSLLVDVRQAYRSTTEALARAIEAHDPRRRGHAERVAMLSTEAGRLLGMQGHRLENLTYGALFHDVGRIGQDEDTASHAAPSGADILANVGFLSGAVPILRIMDSGGGLESSQAEGDIVSAYIVSFMSELDDETQGLPSSGPPRSRAIGVRLYEGTRRDVDRVLRRVEDRLQAGRLGEAGSELAEAW